MISLRPSGFDELGLRRALSDRALPLLVAAMTFLAVLALAGWFGIAGLSQHWRNGAGSALTVQVPEAQAPATGMPGTRLAAALDLLTGAVQAYIFAILAMVFIAGAVGDVKTASPNSNKGAAP